MNWQTNQPNARFWVLKLIKDSFHPGDRLVETSGAGSDLAAQAFVTPAGRKLLLVNKRNHSVDVAIPGVESASALTVDLESGDGPARQMKSGANKITLAPFAVTVVSR
jgi:hypothetical protein